MKNKNQYTKLVIGINDFGSLYKKQSLDWDYLKNEKNPSDFLGAGKTKIWWKCHVCGYEWQASLDARKNHGCTICGQKRTKEAMLKQNLNKHGSFGDKFPDLIRYWDFEKNNLDTPYTVSSTSTKKYFWICEKRHSFDRPINQFSTNHKCPICSDRSFCLALMIYKLVILKFLKIGVRKIKKRLLSIYVALENLYFGNVIFATMSGRLLFGIELVMVRVVLIAREKR